MDTSSLVNLYDRLDSQRKMAKTTSSFDYPKDTENNPEMELPSDVPSGVQDTSKVDNLPSPAPVPSLPSPQPAFYKFEPDQNLTQGPIDQGLVSYKQNFDKNWGQDLTKHCHHLKDKCCKKIILDIYCKIIPLDNAFVKQNPAVMSKDIDNYLASKGMDGYSYMTSAREHTKAPLVEHLIQVAENIVARYVDEATKEKQENGKKGIHLPPKNPEMEEEMDEEIVDAKQDPEYKSFIKTLKEKTMDKIVKDVSNLINAKKDEKNMTFDPKKGQTPNKKVTGIENKKIIDDDGATKTVESKQEVVSDEVNKKPEVKNQKVQKMNDSEEPDENKEKQDEEQKDEKKEDPKTTDAKKESILSVCVDYANRYMAEHNIDIKPELNEKIIALAIRESTLMQLDRVFNFSINPELRNLKIDLYNNQGSVINESGLQEILNN